MKTPSPARRLRGLAIAGVWLAACLAAHAGAAPVISTLIDNEGLPLPPVPRAVPADAGQRVSTGLYATEQQARWLESAVSDVISVRVRCCGPKAQEQAVRQALDSPLTDAPILVRGNDVAQAAQVVNRLSASGRQRVWLVSVQ